MLENQNKALIEELKKLKELYTGSGSSNGAAAAGAKLVRHLPLAIKAIITLSSLRHIFRFQARLTNLQQGSRRD